MSAAGAAGAVPVPQQGQPIFGGGRPRHWIRSMNGRSTTIQAPDGTVSEVPTAHMPRGSAPGSYLDEQAFMAGHQQRQQATQAQSPFLRQLAAAAPGVAQRPVVASPGAVAAAPLPPPTAPVAATTAVGSPPPAPLAAPAASEGPAVGSVAWMNSLTPDQQVQLAGGATALNMYKTQNIAGADHPMTADQVAQLLGGRFNSASNGTAAYNATQQQFTSNNQGYGTTGYQGNAAQVASQAAHGAQASGIPTGVLDSSFWQGGSNFGGGQNAGNTAPGNNGATNWNDPSVSQFGVDPNLPTNLVTGIAGLRTALNNPGVSTGDIGRAVTSIPAAYANYQAIQAQPAMATSPFVGTMAGAAPVNARDYQAASPPGPGSATAVSYAPNGAAASGTDGPSSGSVDYAPPVQATIQQPAQGSISGGGYTPPATATATKLVDSPQQQQPTTTQKATVQPVATMQSPAAASPPPAVSPPSAFQQALANAKVAPSTGPAVESRTGRAHF